MKTEAPVEYRDIEWLLMQRHAKSTIMPRFTPSNWWECDVCEITNSGYMREFEIKMSRSDFKVDAEKSRVFFNGDYSQPYSQRPIENKHALLASGDPRGPSVFYFVTPVGLLKEEEIPLWAGLIEVSRTVGATWGGERTIKTAPRLHKQKANESVAKEMRRVSYGRLHGIWWDRYTQFRDDRYIKERPQFEVEVTP